MDQAACEVLGNLAGRAAFAVHLRGLGNLVGAQAEGVAAVPHAAIHMAP
jgi:hypothetical protein